MDADRLSLAAEMDRQRRRLRKKWKQVAHQAGMTEQHLLRIRQGVVPISADAAYGIEQALDWPEGYIARQLEHVAHSRDDVESRLRAAYEEYRKTHTAEQALAWLHDEVDRVNAARAARLADSRAEQAGRPVH